MAAKSLEMHYKQMFCLYQKRFVNTYLEVIMMYIKNN